MPMPNYTITSKIANCLMRIEAAKEKVLHLPLTVSMLSSLRETARLYTTHYSTMIEGNRLEPKQIEEVLSGKSHFPKYRRDENEVKGYYAALTQVEQWAARTIPITGKAIQTLHALVMASGKSKVKPTSYRDGQNIIRDSRTRAIIYMPPEAKDVPKLMSGMIDWIRDSEQVPCPIIAGIAHYQFVTIHPYYDGNGRTARLLTTLILHLGGYDLKGLYSLEEYYAKNLGAYYEAISVGPSHNYYMGRAEADITKWVEYFVEGMANSFGNVLQRINEEEYHTDQTNLIRKLDPKQRKALELFQEFSTITASKIGELFNFKPRTSAQLCKKWVEMGFIEIVDFSNRGRKYKLSKQYEDLISN
ncbi:Fic family protein [Wolbachia pipientis]|uniref:Fic family protein n=1 Tax=Wolbachia pipientis TaxID=955 RepID=UPI0016511113|nr:Fic family protein [Wolbachia pipientis]MBC6686617.1 Fic family protein [Wolbachia pipientis]